MVKFKISPICVFLYLFAGQIAFAEDSFCYRDDHSSLLCFKTMEEVPEVYREKAFYKVSAGIEKSQNLAIEEIKSSPPTALPPAKSFEEINTNTEPIPLESKEEAKLEIFVAKWCAHCRALEKFLKERGVQYKRYDVETDEYGARIYEEEGTIPISILNRKTILGFDPRKYGEILDAELPY